MSAPPTSELLIVESDSGEGVIGATLTALGTLPGGTASPAILVWTVPAARGQAHRGMVTGTSIRGTFAWPVTAVEGTAALRQCVADCSESAAAQAAADDTAQSVVVLTACRLTISISSTGGAGS